MNENQISELINDELKRAECLHPVWPDDLIHQSAIVGEESGELLKACLDYHYHGKGTKMDIAVEAIQTAAMSIRFLKNFN